MKHSYLALDLGATSGRAILGSLKDGKLEMEEIYRFPNAPIERDGHLCWDFSALLSHIVSALKLTKEKGVRISSVGIDTWGVDVVFFDAEGKPFGMQYSYRDRQTQGITPEFFSKRMPKEELYSRTGIQIMDFNTVFQLYSISMRDGETMSADRILFLPDALAYMLSGKMTTEYTIASTSALMNPVKHTLDPVILSRAGVMPSQFPEISLPATVLGPLSREMRKKTGLGDVKVVTVAGHDTASAIAAVPALGSDFAYLSSGTWSLMGIETREPVINDRTALWNITNEGGVDFTTRLLKNITGMWILEQCIRHWKDEGKDYSYDRLKKMASEAEHFARFIDPDDPVFASPVDMIGAIDAYLDATGQPLPKNDGEYVALIYESLALKYRFVFSRFQELSADPLRVLHIIGGGSKNDLLDQYTASSLGVTVKAGPAEATAIGNLMLQARAAGEVSSLAEMRKVISDSVTPVTFVPKDTQVWNAAYEKFLKTTKI